MRMPQWEDVSLSVCVRLDGRLLWHRLHQWGLGWGTHCGEVPDLKQWEGGITECEDARGRRESRYLSLWKQKCGLGRDSWRRIHGGGRKSSQEGGSVVFNQKEDFWICEEKGNGNFRENTFNHMSVTKARLHGIYEGGGGETVEAVMCNPGRCQLLSFAVIA